MEALKETVSTEATSSDLPLFPSNLPVDAVTRFDPAESAGSPPSMAERYELILRVFDAADTTFISSYARCLVEFGMLREDFIAGEVTAVYEKRNGKLSEREQKSLGGLFIQLQRKGVIEKTGGYRARNQGNPSAVYRLKK